MGNNVVLKIPNNLSHICYLIVGYTYGASGCAVDVFLGILSVTWNYQVFYTPMFGIQPDSVGYDASEGYYYIHITSSGYASISAIRCL